MNAKLEVIVAKVAVFVISIALMYVLLRLMVSGSFNSDINMAATVDVSEDVFQSSYHFSFNKMLKLYKEQAKDRRSLLYSVVRNTREEKYMPLYNILVPEVYCPVKVRVGRASDGGKWMCDPFRIPEKSVIFSLGYRKEASFEKELQKIKEFRMVSKKAKICCKTDEKYDVYTLGDLMKLQNITEIEILKVDIEGAEHDVMPRFLQERQPAQVIIEIHSSSSEMAKLLLDISRQGYWLYWHEINAGLHIVCEFSFLHESAFDRYNAVPLARKKRLTCKEANNASKRLILMETIKVHCPVMVRVGNVGDGGKWMCDPFRIPRGSTVFSLGLNNEISFEIQLQEISDRCCYIFAFDRKEQRQETKDRFKKFRGISKKARISNKTDEENDIYTLDELMKLQSIRKIEILKMDIEATRRMVMNCNESGH
ncbi:hypothetical protein RB195_006647 [Necator americanus]|uniref:Methyltransferase domain-containing protein n=1 Tax=Necator americanus TaxID=51031 RepID=A0ABR1BTK9_NECAM